MILAPTLSLLSTGTGAALQRPTFSRDFAGEKTLDNGTGPAITFTRASGATYFDANGVLQTAANDVPRFDHDPATGASRGLLIEEARTNSIRNSQGGGAVVGAPGTLPTNWISSDTPASGITREIVATGTVNGMSYVDIRFSGTATVAAAFNTRAEGNTQVVAASGQTWTASAYVSLAGGSTAGLSSVNLSIDERQTDGTLITATVLGIVSSLGSSLSRYSVTRTLGGSAGRTNLNITVNVTNGATIDITLRIAAPQLELGAFPTSYIPTTTAAATRATETAIVESPLFSSAYNSAEGTLFGEYIFYHSVPAMRMLQVDDGTNAERMALALTSGSTPQNFSQTGGVTTLSSNPATGVVTVGTVYKTAAAFAANNMIASSNGTLGDLDSSGAMPVGPLGRIQVSGNTARGHWIRKIAYYPKRLTNTLLEQLTT